MRLRNRTVKAEFWADLKLRHLPLPYKLVYIGLWQACDDAGYGTWEPSELAALLFPYDPPEEREPLILGAFASFREDGLVKLERCGHFIIPSLPKHVYSSKANRTSSTQRDHEAGRCPKPPRGAAARRGVTRHDEATRGMTGVDGQDRIGSDRIGSGDSMRPSAGAATTTVEELKRLIADPASTEPARRAARKALERIGVDS